MSEQEIDRLIRECVEGIAGGLAIAQGRPILSKDGDTIRLHRTERVEEFANALLPFVAPLRSRLLELERELVEGREDTARLDWLDIEGHENTLEVGTGERGQFWTLAINNQTDSLRDAIDRQRTAIDAARAAETGKEPR